jgi:hypothetical protein
MKTCTKCNDTKDLSSFGKYTKNKDGLKEVCKDCRKLEAKEYFKTKDRQRHSLETIRARAKRMGIDFDLEYNDLIVPEKCPVFGYILERTVYSEKKNRHLSPSVDRIDPSKGYTKNNIQIISNLANVMKHDATPEQLIMFANWVLKTYKGN